VRLGESPAKRQVASGGSEQQQQPAEEGEALGLHFAGLTNEMRRELRVGRDVQGVVISDIDRGSVADQIGLARGDIVMSINQHPVKSPTEAAQQLKEIAKTPKKSALLLLNRHGVTQYVGIRLNKNEG